MRVALTPSPKLETSPRYPLADPITELGDCASISIFLVREVPHPLIHVDLPCRLPLPPGGRRRRPEPRKELVGRAHLRSRVAAPAREIPVGRHDDRLSGGCRALDLADDGVVSAAAGGHADAEASERRSPLPRRAVKKNRRLRPRLAQASRDLGNEGGAVLGRWPRGPACPADQVVPVQEVRHRRRARLPTSAWPPRARAADA
jgi:hypothetical protein